MLPRRVTCFFLPVQCWGTSAIWSVELSHAACAELSHAGLCCNRSCWVVQIVHLTSKINQECITTLSFLFPQMQLVVQPHPHGEAELLQQSCCQFEMASLGHLPWTFTHAEHVTPSLCSWKAQEVCWFVFLWMNYFKNIFQPFVLILVHFMFVYLFMFSNIYLKEENENIISPWQLKNSFGFCFSRWLIVYMIWIRLTVSHFTAACSFVVGWCTRGWNRWWLKSH